MNSQLMGEMQAAVAAELRLLEGLAELEGKKTEALVANRAADLDLHVKGQQALVWQLGRAEERRLAVQELLARELGLPPGDLTAAHLVESAPLEARAELESLRQKCLVASASLSERNRRNGELIRGALAYASFAAQVLRGSAGAGVTYSASGPARPAAPRRDPRVLDSRT